MRKSRDTLTGGTGDVNPQILTFPAVTMAAANTFQSFGMPMPVTRGSTSGKQKTVIIEALKFWIDLPNWDNLGSTTPLRGTAAVQVATGPLQNISINDPRVIAYVTRTWLSQQGTATTVFGFETDPTCVDLTDNAGHGLLIGSDNLYIGIATNNFLGVGSTNIKMLYRFKEVSLQEYIGIVQSQQ